MATFGPTTQNDGNRVGVTWEVLRASIAQLTEHLLNRVRHKGVLKIYGVPKNGLIIALLVERESPQRCTIVMDPSIADVIVDDLIGSGRTRERYKVYNIPFLTLVREDTFDDEAWIVFPWEIDHHATPTDHIVRMIEYIGEDPNREGLKETPERVVKSWQTLYGGYAVDPKSILKIFEDDSSDEMILLKDIEMHSTCEHHLLPIHGKAHIAYVPDNRVVGISKLARVLEAYSRRLQIQERICQQVTSLLDAELKPKGAACVIEAQHFCMTSRGVEKQNSVMVTSSLTGVFKTDAATRNEFYRMIGD